MLRSLAHARPALSLLRGASAHAAPLRRLRHSLAAPAANAASGSRWRAASAVAAVAAVTVGVASGAPSVAAAAASAPQSNKPRELYPPIEPHTTGMLQVSPVHTLRYEECGNKHGKPVVFLHGGPGGGCLPSHRRFFDPAVCVPSLWRYRGMLAR